MSYYCESCQQTYGVGECLDRDKVKKLLIDAHSELCDWFNTNYGPFDVKDIWPEMCERTEKLLKRLDKFIDQEFKE